MVEYCGRNVDWCDAHHCMKEQWCGTLSHGRRRESERDVVRGGEQELDAPADDQQELDAPADDGLGLDAPSESSFSEWLSEAVDTLLGADDSAADSPVDTDVVSETEPKSEVSPETVDASETDPQEATETTAAPQTDEQTLALKALDWSTLGQRIKDRNVIRSKGCVMDHFECVYCSVRRSSLLFCVSLETETYGGNSNSKCWIPTTNW